MTPKAPAELLREALDRASATKGPVTAYGILRVGVEQALAALESPWTTIDYDRAEGLPELKLEVLITDGDNVSSGYWDGTKWWLTAGGTAPGVTHWQPMPEPPEPKP